MATTNSQARTFPVDTPLGSNEAGRKIDVMIALVGFTTLALALVLDVATERVVMPDGTALGGTCWSVELFGLACPFCGMTRSVIGFFHGDLALSRNDSERDRPSRFGRTFGFWIPSGAG